MSLQKTNTEWLNSLRALATLGVILIHISTPTVKMTYGKQMDYWLVGNLFDTAVRFAVPIFLMLSGATLLGKEYSLRDFYQKRMLRVLVPFLFWAPLYVLFSWFTVTHTADTHTWAYKLVWLSKLWSKSGISVHFWYIYLILVLYLFIPFLNKALKKLSNKAITVILVLWFCMNILNMIVPITFDKIPFLTKLIGYMRFMGYILLGYYLFKLNISIVKARIWGWILFVFAWTLCFAGTFLISQVSKKLNFAFYDYLGICAMTQAAGLFLICKNSEIKNKIISKIRDSISNYSYGIYLVHIMVIGVFFINGLFWNMAHPLLSIPALVLGTWAVSFSIIYLLRKIPGGKHIAG